MVFVGNFCPTNNSQEKMAVDYLGYPWGIKAAHREKHTKSALSQRRKELFSNLVPEMKALSKHFQLMHRPSGELPCEVFKNRCEVEVSKTAGKTLFLRILISSNFLLCYSQKLKIELCTIEVVSNNP